jgi:hypothetical protein
MGGVVPGTETFARRMLARTPWNPHEQPSGRHISPSPLGWDAVVRAVEADKGESWDQFRDRYGDWGRDAALWLARTLGRQKLADLAKQAGALHYATVAAAVNRVGRRLTKDPAFAKNLRAIQQRLSKSEI